MATDKDFPEKVKNIVDEIEALREQNKEFAELTEQLKQENAQVSTDCRKLERQLGKLKQRLARFGTRVALLMFVTFTLTLIIAAPLSYYLGNRGIKNRSAPPLNDNDKVILRLHGSNTIGSELARDLATEFLKQELKAQNVTGTPGSGKEEYIVTAILPGQSNKTKIEIVAPGSARAFTDLAAGTADVGMSSRPITPQEAQILSDLGKMTDPCCEHILGMDGVAVIVNRQNRLSSLQKDQIQAIFSGDIQQWPEVGVQGGDIRVCARDDRSGTFDTFKALVLQGKPLTGNAKRFSDSRELSDNCVAKDPNAIGFIGLPFVREAKAIAVYDRGTRPLLPTPISVATEDYVLSRRLYLYTAAGDPATKTGESDFVDQFIKFAVYGRQDLLDKDGFVPQTIVPDVIEAPRESVRALLGPGWVRLSLNFRFRSASSELDNKALADLKRVFSFMHDPQHPGRAVGLLGYADANGTKAANCKVSKERAEAVAQAFYEGHLAPSFVEWRCDEDPVASNSTDEGRQKNRRVELWGRM